jgi:hypothetical protein
VLPSATRDGARLHRRWTQHFAALLQTLNNLRRRRRAISLHASPGLLVRASGRGIVPHVALAP